MNKTFIVIAILLTISIGIYLFVEFKLKKWSCVEGRCERILNGDHSSLEKCQQQCSVKQPFTRKHHKLQQLHKERRETKHVTFSPNLVDYSPTPPPSYT